VSPKPELAGGAHDGAGAGAGAGSGAGIAGAGFLAGALRFGAAFFAERFTGFRAADFATFFFLRAGAAFFFVFVDFFLAFAFFAMIVLPIQATTMKLQSASVRGRVHATIPTSTRQPATAKDPRASCRPRSCTAGGQGPPLAQSINSTVWTVGTLVPAAI
jgi:hypothetical protein